MGLFVLTDEMGEIMKIGCERAICSMLWSVLSNRDISI